MGGTHSVEGASVASRWDGVFRALSQEPRRKLVLTLSDRPTDAWVGLPEAARSPHFDGTRDELAVALRHRHLPALAAGEYVEWTATPFEATRGEHFDDLDVVLETLVSKADALPPRLVHGCDSLERQLR